ncbi:MAG: DNA cytosine methyltransferase [Akkermansiaceae bacterium]|nr:DNA cytosine methyltransferase [Akkermansiaceae bacterium]
MSLFSGIGGFELAFKRAGLGHLVLMCESDARKRKVLLPFISGP